MKRIVIEDSETITPLQAEVEKGIVAYDENGELAGFVKYRLSTNGDYYERELVYLSENKVLRGASLRDLIVVSGLNFYQL